MVEPKIEKDEKKEEKVEVEKKASEKPASNPESAPYWNYVQGTKMLEVPKVAIFSGEGGLIVLPLDRLGRALLDSSLFFPIETLEILASSMEKLADQEEK